MRRRWLAPAVRRTCQRNLRDHPITATSHDTKAMRGTKRVCQACAVRFYDLSREPIVCPSCGAHHVPLAPPVVAEAGARGRTVYGQHRLARQELQAPEPEPDVAPQVAATEDATEEAPSPVPNEDVVLEQEPDETDISGLLGRHGPEPKER